MLPHLSTVFSLSQYVCAAVLSRRRYQTALSRWRSLWLLGYSISVTRTLICSQGGVVYYYSYYN
jgi:hypothetical protein